MATDVTPSDLSNAIGPQHCRFCGSAATTHAAGACLDRWVHQSFLGHALTEQEVPPPYSASPRQPCLEDVISTPKWAESVAVMQTSEGCTVGVCVGRSHDYFHFEVLTSASSLSLVCAARSVWLGDGWRESTSHWIGQPTPVACGANMIGFVGTRRTSNRQISSAKLKGRQFGHNIDEGAEAA